MLAGILILFSSNANETRSKWPQLEHRRSSDTSHELSDSDPVMVFNKVDNCTCVQWPIRLYWAWPGIGWSSRLCGSRETRVWNKHQVERAKLSTQLGVPLVAFLAILPYSIFVLGNRRHEERCCFPTDFNVQLQLQTLCIRCLFDSSKNKPLEHYTHNALLALAVFFLSLSYFKGQTITEWLLMVSHNTIVLSLTDPTVNSC